MKDPNTLGAVEAVRAMAAGTLTSEQLVLACLERIHARDPEVLAWAHLDPALALSEAVAVRLPQDQGSMPREGSALKPAATRNSCSEAPCARA